MLDFLKMHGLGNDFVVIDGRTQDVAPLLALPPAIARLADRHTGIGFDQLIIIAESMTADAEMLIRNADGSVAGMCGNAARCVADLLMTERGTVRCTLAVGERVLDCWRTKGISGDVSVDMGPPRHVGTADVGIPGLPQAVTVDMGNPHAVFIVPDANAVDLETLGPVIETHPLFPKRTNVEFLSTDGDALRMRVWERGAGVTLACGSGACASAYAAFSQNIAPRRMAMRMDGGTLHLEVREDDGHILMSGPATTVFKGTFTV